MRLALIGVGQAGGKILDRFIQYDDAAGAGFITGAIAINTARTDLHGLESVPDEHRVLVGQERTKGHGVGADNELGADIAKENRAEILGAIDRIPVARTDAFVVIGALGGGTGSGAGPVIARHLSEIYAEPVYGLAILPASNEGGIYTLNAARSFKTFVRETDNLLCVDNDAWRRPNESISGAYDVVNDEIARRFGVLFSAGEIEPAGGVAETVVDSSEIINTLDGGGVTSVGYARETLDRQTRGFLARFRADGYDADAATNRITSLVRQATRGRLTLPCDVTSTDRALVLASGPPQALSRQGIERGRNWLETEAETAEVRGGDYPVPGASQVSVAVMLSGITASSRVDRLKEVAVETQDGFASRDAERDRELSDFLTDDHDRLDPLF